jgi:hypothetical protein
MRTQDAAIPFAHEDITAVHEAVANAHVAQPLLAVLQLLQQLEVAGRYYCFSGWQALHVKFGQIVECWHIPFKL